MSNLLTSTLGCSSEINVRLLNIWKHSPTVSKSKVCLQKMGSYMSKSIQVGIYNNIECQIVDFLKVRTQLLKQTWNWEVEFQVYFKKSSVWFLCSYLLIISLKVGFVYKTVGHCLDVNLHMKKAKVWSKAPYFPSDFEKPFKITLPQNYKQRQILLLKAKLDFFTLWFFTVQPVLCNPQCMGCNFHIMAVCFCLDAAASLFSSFPF